MASPLIGVALHREGLEAHREFVVAEARDLEVQDFFLPDVLAGDWRPLADHIAGLIDGHEGRRGIHGPFVGFAIDCRDPEIAEIATRRLMTGLDVATRLEATQMVVHSPYTTWDHANLDDEEGRREAKIEAVEAVVGPVARRAGEEGITLVFENIEDKDPADRARMIEALGRAAALSVDTGHAHYAHVATGGKPVDEFVRAAGSRLAHVHLQDADGHADRHWAIGDGNVPWAEVFAAIAEGGADPHLVLELRDHRDVPRSIRWLAERGLGR